MKLEGLNYDLNSLNVLLNYINRENILDYDISRVLTEKLRLEQAIDLFDKEYFYVEKILLKI